MNIYSRFFIFASVLLSGRVYANLQVEVPANYCDASYYQCGAETLEWVKKYLAGISFQFASEKNLLIGSCHMVSASYDPDHEHHGFLFFRKEQDRQMWSGTFSFFAATNPYSDWKISDAERATEKDTFYEFIKFEKGWRSDLFEDPPYQYFLRENQGHFYLIGFWGIHDSIVCRLDPTLD